MTCFQVLHDPCPWRYYRFLQATIDGIVEIRCPHEQPKTRGAWGLGFVWEKAWTTEKKSAVGVPHHITELFSADIAWQDITQRPEKHLIRFDL
jgi:hypothetical protein